MDLIILSLIIALLPWFFLQIKAIFFWVYVWQLKDYHIGRFVAHFSTQKGKEILLNKVRFFKFLILLIYIGAYYNDDLASFWIFFISLGVLGIYGLEFLYTIYQIVKKRIIKPVFNLKTIVLILAATALLVTYLGLSVFYLNQYYNGVLNILFYAIPAFLLFFDVFSGVFFSLIVLMFQPLTVLYRNHYISKAKKKMAKFPEMTVIGITGSYGKSSTKEFLSEILSAKFKVFKTQKNQNSEMGISAHIISNLEAGYDIFICEMGAYHKGGIKMLTDIVNPKIGILTGINQQHLATFGSQETITNTKFELIQSLPENGIAILNCNNQIIKNEINSKERLEKISARILVKCSTKEKADIWIEKLSIQNGKINFTVKTTDNDSADFVLELIGGQNIVENILLAIACAKKLGMSLAEISKACQNIEPEQSPTKILRGINDIAVIDSTYSSNPDGVLAALDYLTLYEGKRVIVMPCIIELGNQARILHQEIGKKIGQVCDMAIITTKDYFNEIRDGAIEEGMAKDKILFLEDGAQIFQKIKDNCGADDVVLLESRVPQILIKMLLLVKD